MAVMPGITLDLVAGPKNGQIINPIAVVLHRTSSGIPNFNDWAGAYSVGKNGVGFHFLVGAVDGQWVQLYDSTWMAWHVGEENPYSIGIEICGNPGEPMTPWQISAATRIVQWCASTHGIPLDRYSGGPHTSMPGTFHGFIDHRSIIQSQEHQDYWNDADWAACLNQPPPIDWAALAALIASRRNHQMWLIRDSRDGGIYAYDGTSARLLSPTTLGVTQAMLTQHGIPNAVYDGQNYLIDELKAQKAVAR